MFTSGRLVIIPFERHFAEDERDTSLKDRFQTPQARSTILNWMLAGYQDYLNKGLKIPDFAKAATEQYRHDSDKTQLFIEDCMRKRSASEFQIIGAPLMITNGATAQYHIC